MSETTAPIRIDFVSDVSCPWCAIGLQALEQAIARVGDDARVELHFQPFELNPALAAEGEDAIEHLTAKYGMSEQQARDNGEAIRARGAELGFTFEMDRRRHVWNTFDAHRLLHWAGLEAPGKQRALNHALLRAYFTDGENVSDHDVLARLAGSAGLDEARARQILASDEFADAVRERERHYTGSGITAVPSVIFNDRHLVQGGQPVDVFERALRQLASGAG
jgi:predicted DsbA family dithiol-disulfide isomerase